VQAGHEWFASLCLLAAQSLADYVGYAAADQSGRGGPVMQAENHASYGRGDAGDFNDGPNVLQIWSSGHAISFLSSQTRVVRG
jgi:hypothetical protein